jgi:hypothetical protein
MCIVIDNESISNKNHKEKLTTLEILPLVFIAYNYIWGCTN